MKNYSWLNTILLINGVEISGFDEGDDVINMERFEDSASHTVGVDGEMNVSIRADRTGFFRFRLAQGSSSNEYLGGLVSSQENGIFVPIFAQFRDVATGDTASGTQGYIPRPATMVRGRDINSQEWQVNVERLDLLYGVAPQL